MPRSVSASRIQVKASFTPSEMPSSANDSVTLALTVPTRGLITRAVLVLTDGSTIGTSTNQDVMFVHTDAAGGAGEDTLTAADVSSIIASFPLAFLSINSLGGDLLFADTIYAVSFSLAQAQANHAGTLTTAGRDAFADGGNAIFYDVSGTTKGPVAGNGTLYFSLIGDGNFDYTAMSSAYVIVDIEPCT